METGTASRPLPFTAVDSSVPPPPKVGLGTILLRLGFGIVSALILAWAWQGAEIKVDELVSGAGNMSQYATAFLKPDFLDWRLFMQETVVTIQIAIWGTLLALIGGIPCGLLMSSNISPRWIRVPLRRLMDTCRSVNEIVYAMLFITAVGLGPFAGVLALFIHNLGVIAKLFSEAVEAIEPGPIEGIRATGAHSLAEVVYGVIPQVIPLWLSTALYRFESNVRSAAVVGVVGAGGVGMLLWDAIRSFDYSRTSAILLIIIVVVMGLDMISGRIRKSFI